MRGLRGLWICVLVLSSCVGGPVTTIGGVAGSLAFGLPAFSDCDELLAYVQGHALERVTAWGLPGTGGSPMPVALEGDVAATESAGDRAMAPVAGEDYSTTNVQRAGVDEPDIVKTDGERLVTLTGDRIVVVDVSGPAPEHLGTLRIEGVWPRDLLLLGDRALVLGETDGGASPLASDSISPWGWSQVSALVEVDLSDPAQPRVARRLVVDGRYLSARMRGGVVRVVVSSSPTGLSFGYPEGGGLRGERDALERNREAIRGSTLEDWVPYFVLQGPDGSLEAEGSLLDCDSTRRPAEFSGLSVLSVLTVDLSEGLTGSIADRSTGVLADGETVYASAESLYVATQRWMDWTLFDIGARAIRESFATQIHRFDITGSDRAAYRSSGEVRGWLLNQFSMDEHEGHLRVASTDAPPFWDGSSQSMVTVLAERDGRLAEVGRVGGLGIDERIFAVRFLGDLGYVVTFREVDPLYVVDLSDPTDPRVTGELKIPGYSAYLHPLGDGLLLGVGQDATQDGRLKGTQMSLFDVGDPTAPARLDALRIAGGSSEAEWDHHAFLYWQGLIVLPLTVYDWDSGAPPFSGAIAVRLTDRSLQEAGRLDSDLGGPGGWSIRRTLVIGDLLYTISDAGIEVADLDTLEDVAQMAFPADRF